MTLCLIIEFFKIKNIFASKDIIKKRGKYLQIMISVKGLLSRIYKELTQTFLIENIKNSSSKNAIQFENR